MEDLSDLVSRIDVSYPSVSHYEIQSGSTGTLTQPLNYVSTVHSHFILTQLNDLRADSQLCDVILIVNETRIPAHRVVLASCSTYFKIMFTTEMQESRQKEIPMMDMNAATVQSLVNFCYTGEIRITDGNVQFLLPAACLLQINEIQEVCCEFLKKQLDATNCLGIRAFADTHSCRELLRSADKFTMQNFQDVVNTEEFLLLPIQQLIEIIQSDQLFVRTEEQVFLSVIQWVRHDLAERKKQLALAMEHVRLPFCTAKFIVSTVSEEPLVKADEKCRDYVDEAKKYLLLPLERVNMKGPRFRPRRPEMYGEVVYSVGGWCTGDALASVEQLDTGKLPVWRQVASMSKRRCGVGVAVVDNLLYAVGGHDGQSYLNSVERFDPATNLWSDDVAPTSTCRTSVGVAVLDGYLYAVGGQDGNSCLNVVERYDSSRNEWTKIASMNSRRLGVSVSALNGCLYAIGGSDGQCPLSSVERYDPREGRWHVIRSMSTRRKHLGSAAYDGHIYAVGGRDDNCELSSAERYNPETCEWSPIVAMNNRRSGVGLAVVNDRLYAVGGFDGQGYLKTVEVYDKETKQWRHHSSMTYRRLGGGVGVVRVRNDQPKQEEQKTFEGIM